MGLNVGDVIFNQTGRVGSVTSKDKEARTVQISMEKDKLKTHHPFGYINGLSIEDRQKYNSILEKVHAHSDIQEKMKGFQAAIDETSQDPRNYLLTRYLKSELAHVMHSHNIHPRTYSANEYDVDP